MKNCNYKLYKIVNKINGKCYIGYTCRDIYKRFNEHIHNKRMYVSEQMRKDGIDNFTVMKLASFNKESIARFYEKFFILMNHTLFPNGYNLDCKGDDARFLRLQISGRQYELF